MRSVHVPDRWAVVVCAAPQFFAYRPNFVLISHNRCNPHKIASLLFHHARDDLTNAGQLRRSVEDLSNVRDSKMRKWMQENVQDRVNAIKVNNLSLHEINVHRPILTKVLDNLYTIHVTPDTKGLTSDTRPTTNTASESTPRPAQGRQLRRVIRRN